MPDCYYHIKHSNSFRLIAVLLALQICPLCLDAAEKKPTQTIAQLLKSAHEHKQHGRYDEAEEVYAQAEKQLAESSQKNTEQHTQLILGRVRINALTGKTPQALNRLKSALKETPDRADLHAIAARLYYETGDYLNAKTHVNQALKLDSDAPLAHLIQAHLLTESGKIDEANEGYRWFVRYYNRAQPEDAETLLVIGEGATQYARWNSVSQIFNFVINTVCPDALKADPLCWEASYLSGSILQEKYNRLQVATEYKSAIKTNSQAAIVYVALARSAFQVRDYDTSTTLIKRALEINPRLIEALLLECDLHLINGQYDHALKSAESAASINARAQSVLARKAACYLLLDGVPDRQALELMLETSETPSQKKTVKPLSPRFEQLMTTLLKQNPKPGYFLYELGHLLEMKRQFDFTETVYLKAKKIMPQLSQPKIALGILYMQMGKTDLAQTTLDEAFKSDPYHVRVSNMRKVLGVLESYGSIMTEHFVIRYDSKADFILGQYMADYLESIYPELVTQFGYEPPGKTQFEIYHDAKGLGAHQWFSARMIGLPWIQTIGASTGAVVALTSPTAMKEPFNWASVLKHELVHVFTLQQTKYKIPHWFTEALAVRSEGHARPQKFNQLLAERIPKGEIYSLNELDGVFVRPKSSDNWNFAYCQSLLCAEFMVEEFGEQALIKLLAAYQNQLSTPAAIKESFKIDQAEFEKRYHNYLKTVADSLKGYKIESPLSFNDLQKKYEQDRENLSIAGQYASRLLRLRKKSKAREIALNVLGKDPSQTQAALTIARLELLSEDWNAALKILQPALNLQSPDVEVLELTGRIMIHQDKYKAALVIFETGHNKFPYQTQWLKGLSLIYQNLGKNQKLEETLLKLVHLDPANEKSMKLLTQLFFDQKNHQQALQWATKALHVNVLDPETHQLLAESALKLKQTDIAVREIKMTLHLDDKNEDLRFLLVQTLLDSGKRKEAKTELNLLLQQNPDHVQALELKKTLN
ncbi:MAG: tetratricopeptide repeat protein [Planctomycetes bacterium]|nr:tetratricopeptide repeat protein [Planctomycetota bacterium]MCH9724826.1 tetratricopeptide repeat protein [Planctomycetota bacterium]MCH9778766.1 tetratricopeptide repeat protein [Planctomycetota bacterium]